MSPIIGRPNIGELVKNVTGLRGNYALGLDGSLIPVLDVGRPQIESDDLTAYWITNTGTGAVAAQFSCSFFRCLQGRAVIDGLLFRTQAAASIVRIGLGTAPATGAGVSLRNPYVVRGTTFAPAGNGAGAVFSGSLSQVADPLPTAQLQATIDVPAVGGASQVFGFAQDCEWVLTPGWDLIVSPTVVNVGIGCIAWGRCWPDFGA